MQAPDQRLPRIGRKVTVRFGSPLRLGRQAAGHRAELRDTTDGMMADIAALCGQDYVDRYATTASATSSDT